MKWGMVGLTKIAGMVIAAILVLVSFVLAGAHAVSPSDERNQITVIKDDPKPIKRRPEDPEICLKYYSGLDRARARIEPA